MIEVTNVRIPQLPTKEPRRLYVYTPGGYSGGGERFPVLYMFDGHNVFYDSHATYGKSWGMKEYLESTGRKLIVVAVESDPEGWNRVYEYAPFGFSAPMIGTVEPKGMLTMDWLVNELKVMIDREYRTLPDREHTGIAGSSMGGLMSLYAVTEYNEVFSKAAALSPSLWVQPRRFEELAVAKKLLDPTRIYMDMGGAETDIPNERCEGLLLAAKRLTEAGADVDARIFPGAKHCEAEWEKRIPVFFDHLFGEDA